MGTDYSLNCVLPDSYTEGLTLHPAPQNVTMFGDLAFTGVIKVKTRPLQCALIQSDWGPDQKRKFGGWEGGSGRKISLYKYWYSSSHPFVKAGHRITDL